MGRLTGRVALVTGASRGFGRAIALLFAREGADIVVNYHAAEAAARAVADEVERIGRRALVVRADVADPKQVATLAERTQEVFGRVDVLVNNAGIIEFVPFLEQDPASWRRIVDVNVYGPLHLTRRILPGMIERRYGRIVNLSSMAGHTGGSNAKLAVYAGTKGFLLASTKALAYEVGPYGITVNAVCPSNTPTDMNRDRYPPEYRVKRSAEIPVRRLGDPTDVAHAVLYLASDEAAFVTGQCIDINGGTIMV